MRARRKKISRAARRRISRKIKLLIREGKPQKQAVAIAYRMAGVARPRRRVKAKNSYGRRKRMYR